ncbi:MAG TPA: hypothetical protein VF069_18045 [Streptosporangiaceae bacterium]
MSQSAGGALSERGQRPPDRGALSTAVRETQSTREPRDAAWTEERAERGTSEHATREGRGQSAASAVRETQ